ncbi:hypothetical protein C7N43_04955 [Sphingobacteriales bacterium UPWRP_1]|nr:hypothetical protein BVG80_06880 [Sphingobacteriales bacterium TSM_CSM]PSJ78172.1 hypothetical protein C7N43_04955 [Sphingobacteriales bacterium UPWRP_1]
MPDNVFVYVVCGSAEHIETLHYSLQFIQKYSKCKVVVVTDLSRNQLPIRHHAVIDIPTPAQYNNHQASIYLKTGLHRFLNLEHNYCYIDTDVIANSTKIDQIFQHQYGPVTFAKDYTHQKSNISTFSPWALNCGCLEKGISNQCLHLAQAIGQQYHIQIPPDWVHWNGGVFLFNRHSVEFMQTWHQLTLHTFDLPLWRTRDQGTLIVTVWKFGLQNQKCLPQQFNFIADLNNADLTITRTGTYALHPDLPKIKPHFLHLYSSPLHQKGWNLEKDLQNVVIQRNRQQRRLLNRRYIKQTRIYKTLDYLRLIALELQLKYRRFTGKV